MIDLFRGRSCYIRRAPLVALMLLLSCGHSAQTQRVQQAQYHADLAYGYLMESRDPNAALHEVLKSLKLYDKSANTHHLAALIFMGRSDWLKALKHAKRALELKPDFHEAKNNLGAVYLALGEWREAVKVFTELTSTLEYRTPARGYNNLGWALYKLNQPQEAKQALMRAVKLNPRLCPPHNNLGLVSLALNDLALAERELKKSASLCPTYAEPHLHLARLHMSKGEIAPAMTSLKRCIELGGDSDIGLRCAATIKRAGSPEVSSESLVD